MLPEDASPSKRKFKLLKRIGVGGFGEVYLAELQTTTGFAKTVALKLLRDDVAGGEEMATRIRDEARLLGMMRHRSIVQADDLITLAGRPTVVMEFIPGVNLNWLLNPSRFPDDIPPTCCFEIIRHVADALDVAYSRPSSITGRPLEVLHRDIKPSNIRITPDGEVKVLDFGIARSDHMERESQTQDYNLGSLRYMAPEMLIKGIASPGSDIYSLGVTAFETFSRLRFGLAGDSQGEHDAKIKARFAECDPEPLGEHLEVAVDLIRSMLAYEVEDRPSARTVMKKCQELEKVANGAPMWEWAPEAIPKVQIPEEDEINGELTGKTLYEEPSERVSGVHVISDMDDLQTAVLPAAGASKAAEPMPQGRPPVAKDSGSSWRVVALLGLAIAAVAVYVFRPQPVVEENRQAVPAQEVRKAVQPPAPEPAAEATPTAEAVAAEPAAKEPAPAEPKPAKAATPAAKPAPASTAKPKPVSKASPTPAADPAPKPAGTPAKVKLVSAPFGIAVLVDGKSVGKTPKVVELSPGSHTLTFVDGESNIRKTVTIKAGQEHKYTYRRAEGSIR